MSFIDGVKYVFQIPLEWFKSVDTRVFGDHPGSGVKFEDSSDGSKAIAVDFDVFDLRYPNLHKNEWAGSSERASVAATHPKDVKPAIVTEGKTQEQIELEQIADIGVSTQAARADHVHRNNASCVSGISATFGISITPDYSTTSQIYLDMPAWAPPAKMTGDDANHTPCGWERGKTAWKNGVYCDAEHPPVGCSIKVCSHTILRTVSGTQRVEQFFTNLQFDENGLLIRAIPGCDWYTIPIAT